MEKRWLILYLISILLICQINLVIAACNYDNICDAGEESSFPQCVDCDKPFCSDPRCDPGLGENCNTCPTDCGACDDSPCDNDADCFGMWCVGSPGVCSSTPECVVASECTIPPCQNLGVQCDSDALYQVHDCPTAICDSHVCGSVENLEPDFIMDCPYGCVDGSSTCNLPPTCEPDYSVECDVAQQKIFEFNTCDSAFELVEDCSRNEFLGWSEPYCDTESGYIIKTATTQNLFCEESDETCQLGDVETQDQNVVPCPDGCDSTTNKCLMSTVCDTECADSTSTGCTPDNRNMWYCVPGSDGCYEQEYVDCDAGCEAGACLPLMSCHLDSDCSSTPCVGGFCAFCHLDAECTSPPVGYSPGCVSGDCANGFCSYTPDNYGMPCNNGAGSCLSGECISSSCSCVDKACGELDGCGNPCDVESCPLDESCEPAWGGSFDCVDCVTATQCTNNPYHPDCSAIACDSNLCLYNPANEDGYCDGNEGTCSEGGCSSDQQGIITISGPVEAGVGESFTIIANGHDDDGITSIMIVENTNHMFDCGLTSCQKELTQAKTIPDIYPFHAVMHDTLGNQYKSMTMNVHVREECEESLWYYDADNDLYGTFSSITACSPHENYRAAMTGDCDDTNPDKNPGTTEVCDGEDNDCDNIVDEGLPVYYIDRDQDAYGNSFIKVDHPSVSSFVATFYTGTVYACIDIGKYASTNKGDCNDDAREGGDIHPPQTYENGALCSDGIDNDCDQLIDELDGSCHPCGDIICAEYAETKEEWRQDGCWENRISISTAFFPSGCEAEMCTYRQGESTETPLEETRPVADGSTCPGGFCSSGECILACSDFRGAQPGCQEAVPRDAALDESHGCVIGKCYTCPDNFNWDGSRCAGSAYHIESPSFETVAGESIIITLVTLDKNDQPIQVRYRYDGFRSGESDGPFNIKTLETDVGVQELIVTAVRIDGNSEETLTTKRIIIEVYCPPDMACCPSGTHEYAPTNSACRIHSIPGTCAANGECQVSCRDAQPEHTSQQCNDGIDNDCDGAKDCIRAPDGSYEKGCANYCDIFCSAGKSVCDGSCVNTFTDRKNCGSCGERCEKTEACMQGECIESPGCYDACGNDEDCGSGQSCFKPGTCHANCGYAQVIILDEEVRDELLTSVVRQRTHEIKKELSLRGLTITATSLVGELDNFTLVITIPKQLAESASEISSDVPFEIIHDDPVIKTTLAALEGKQEIHYSFLRPVDVGLHDLIVVDSDHARIDLSEAKPLSEDDLVITQNFIKTDEGTTVTLTLDPGATLEDLRIPLEIPKCLANSISELSFDRENYVVINDDPLMVWTFDELSVKESISFSIPKDVDEDCQEQLKAFGMASGKRKPVSPWLPLAIIPVIGFILLFFQRFHETEEKKAKTHLSKEEFFELGHQQGQSDVDLERSWHEYCRRF